MKRAPHPPYSPDLAPCDFYLFGYVKDRLSSDLLLLAAIEAPLVTLLAFEALLSRSLMRIRNCY
jgi:hypothetical protein